MKMQVSAQQIIPGAATPLDDGSPFSRSDALLSIIDDAPINILIVDDEPKNLTVLETVLDLPSYRLVRAASADEALLALVTEEFALLILDIRMPGMTGFELAQIIKGRRKTARVPIIFLTAYYNEDQHALEGYDSGAVDYLHKPINAAVLRSKVAVFADLHRKTREVTIANRALMTEVAERRRAEQQLQVLNDDLDRRVSDRTLAVRQLEADLRAADQRKDEFIATLAHELRNPLAPVRNALYVLQRQNWAGPAAKNLRDIITRQVRVMARLIDDLMDVSRINQGRIELQRELVDLSVVIELAVEASRPYLDEGGHAFSLGGVEPGVLVDVDVTRLTQVLVNLLTNAAKYTHHDGRIELTVRRRETEVDITVQDSGIGIDAGQLQQVFVMFAQVEGAVTMSRGGLGIGLSLVKHLVELHGGRVEVSSPGPGQGSAFVVSLPLASSVVADAAVPAPTEKAAGPLGMPTPTGALKILVVDDNHDSAETLAALLSLHGHDVRTAHDGATAVLEATAFRPEVIVLDIGLPDVDGYGICRQIRAQPWGLQITVVALTGWGDEEAKSKSEAAGFDGHLVKPVAEETLLLTLANVKRPMSSTR
ncbi:MAG: response regulator [Tepidisphaeraceae bacterium]